MESNDIKTHERIRALEVLIKEVRDDYKDIKENHLAGLSKKIDSVQSFVCGKIDNVQKRLWWFFTTLLTTLIGVVVTFLIRYLK